MQQLSFDDLEIWRPVAGYEGYYEVSSLGRVRSLTRGSRPGRLRSMKAPPGVHYRLRLHRDKQAATKLVHQLVAVAFLGPCRPGQEVRHKDGDHHNNAASNLEYGTHQQNMNDRLRHGTHYQANMTHCRRDHPFNEINTYFTPAGGRQCRPCRRIMAAARRAAARAEAA